MSLPKLLNAPTELQPGALALHTVTADARSPLSAMVYATLRSEILHARLRPGESMSENLLAERLGISRTPVREAIQRLVAEGLVHVLPQRGSFVSRLRMQSIKEALFIREAVECQIVLEVMRLPNLTDILARLDRILNEQSDALAWHDLDATMAADEDFHRTLINSTGLNGVWQVVAKARDMHQRVNAIAVPEMKTGQQAVKDHRAIVRALRDRDEAAAVSQIRIHLRRNADLTLQLASLHPDYFE